MKYWQIIFLTVLIVILSLAADILFPTVTGLPKKEIKEGQETLKEEAEEETTEEKEVRLIMDEIDSLIDDLTGLDSSINELDENEDLLKVFEEN